MLMPATLAVVEPKVVETLDAVAVAAAEMVMWVSSTMEATVAPAGMAELPLIVMPTKKPLVLPTVTVVLLMVVLAE